MIRGEPITFDHTGDAGAYGETSYVWDFGDGTVIENTNTRQVLHAYTSAGNKTVKLAIKNPNYGVAYLEKSMAVYNPLSASTCVNGVRIRDLCNDPNNPPAFGTCTDAIHNNEFIPPDIEITSVSGGCPGTYTYKWEHRKNSGPWRTLRGTTSTTLSDTSEGYHYVRCTITDACNNQVVTSQETFAFTKSTSPCNPGEEDSSQGEE